MTLKRVEDVMTRDVATVGSDADFRDIAGRLETWQVGALPVVDDEYRVLGIVSKGDLRHTRVAKAEAKRVRSGPLRGTGLDARDDERTARGLMTSPVVTVAPTASTLRAAGLMDRYHVKRLPVVDRCGRLVGIVSRCDLLGAFLRPDAEIRADIENDVLGEVPWLKAGAIVVDVRDAVVHLAGEVEHPALIDIVVRLCRAVDGVDDVTHDITHPLATGRSVPGSPADPPP